MARCVVLRAQDAAVRLRSGRWSQRDSNPRPPPCKRALSQLSYGPSGDVGPARQCPWLGGHKRAARTTRGCARIALSERARNEMAEDRDGDEPVGERGSRQVAAGGRGGRRRGGGGRRAQAGPARRGLEPRHRPPLLRARLRPAGARRRPPGGLLDARIARSRSRSRSSSSDGKIHVFSGYRIQHNGARGPYKGGDPLSPRGRHRRGARAGLADDLEDRRRRHPVRRRQGRRQLPRRPARALRGPDDHPLVHGQGPEGPRARPATYPRPTSTRTPR